ncbi:MAG: cation:proton antiporter [Patescibacteria group bacterium]
MNSIVSRLLKNWEMLLLPILAIFIFQLLPDVFASDNGEASAHGSDAATTFLWLAIILIAAKLSSFVEKFGQPAVLGELVIGVILGNLVLLGLNFFEPIKTNSHIIFLAELGVVILLFQIGLESQIEEMKKVGMRALLVAIVGVVVPFASGTYLIGPWLFPGLESTTYIFLGATLAATSVGITARVFRDFKKLQTKEARIVLGAAVIDDVLGLMILAVVSAMATAGNVELAEIGIIVVKAFAFLTGAILLGQLLAEKLGKIFAKVNAGVGMKFTLVICFGLLLAYFAQQIELAPIVGAFAAGLMLDSVHFRYFKDPKIVADLREHMKGYEQTEANQRLLRKIEKHGQRHIEDLIEPIGHFLVPIFFVVTGMSVNLEALFDAKILLLAFGITVVAIVGKMVSGLAAGKDVNRMIVGMGMVPRGEVGLIFASIGRGLGVISEELFSTLVVVIIFTTLIPPPILAILLKRQK